MSEQRARLGLPDRHTAEYAKRLGIAPMPMRPSNPTGHRLRLFAKRLEAWVVSERRALKAYNRTGGR